jgi:uncharacterized repeat protein (TIGR01451 family)
VVAKLSGSQISPVGNTLARNGAVGAKPGSVDCFDNSTGSASAGTGNTWSANVGASSSPKDLCSPGPITTIDLHPAAPDGPDGTYTGPVHVTVSASHAGGSAVTGTRCILDPPRPPARFRDLPAEHCLYLGPGADVSAPGHHTVYAASVNAAGVKDAAVRSASFTITTVHVTPQPGTGAQPVSDLRIQLKDPRVGQRHTFTITVTNHGPDPARQTIVTFTASLPLRIVSAGAVGHSCTTTLPVHCRLGTLPLRGRVTLRIVAVPRVPGVLGTSAAATSASRDPYPNSSVATASTRIAPAPGVTPPPPRVTG